MGDAGTTKAVNPPQVFCVCFQEPVYGELLIAKSQGMPHCYIPFFMLLIPNGLLVLARHSPLSFSVRSLRAESGQQGASRSSIGHRLLG